MRTEIPWELLGTLQAALAVSLILGTAADAVAQTQCADHALPKIAAVSNPLHPTDPAQGQVGQLRYRGGILLQHQDHRFGAFSGMVVSSDGRRLVAVNNGFWLHAELGYDSLGDLTGFTPTCFAPLVDQHGQPLEWWEDQDAESLTFDGKNYLVGFEENLRVWSYEDFSRPAVDFALPADFSKGVPPGAGYSSVASDQRGGFYLITEFARNASKATKGYVRTPEGEGEIWIVARDGQRVYLPVDLAVLPNGNFLLAEISFGCPPSSDRRWCRARPSRQRRSPRWSPL